MDMAMLYLMESTLFKCPLSDWTVLHSILKSLASLEYRLTSCAKVHHGFVRQIIIYLGYGMTTKLILVHPTWEQNGDLLRLKSRALTQN